MLRLRIRGVRSARYQTSPGVYDIRLSMWTFRMATKREEVIWLIDQSSNVGEIIICNIEEKRFILNVCSRFGQSLTSMHTHSMFIDVLWILRYDLIWNSYIKITYLRLWSKMDIIFLVLFSICTFFRVWCSKYMRWLYSHKQDHQW